MHTPKLAIMKLFCPYCANDLIVWKGKVKDQVVLSVLSPSVSIWNPLQHPCLSVTDLTQTKALLTLLVEGRAERRKGKRWKNRAYLQSFLLWHHTCCAISQNQELEVQGSGMQGQTSLCSGLRGTTSTGITNPATEMQTLFFLLYHSTTKSFVSFFGATPRQ